MSRNDRDINDVYPGHFAPVDPQIATFLSRTAEVAAQYPRRDRVSLAEGRRIGERVKAQWVAGGPEMARTVEREVPTRHGPVRIRVHYPAQRRLPGALMYIHGGGFVVFSLDTHDRVMREYAQRAGIVVVGVDYSLAPEARFPQPLEECTDVMRWLREHADELDVDAAGLFIGGDSAGGNLSLGTCVALRDAGEPLPRGMLLNYGGFSTRMYRDSMVRYGGGEYGLSLHMMAWFYRAYLGRPEDFEDPRMCLVKARLDGLPPALLVIAECDPLYDDSIEMAECLKQAGVEVDARVYPGTVHSFLEAVEIADVAVRAFDESCDWMRRHAEA